MIVNGRADGIIPPNHASRPYYALSRKAPGAGEVRYYEVTNGTHLDAFNAFPGFDARYIPLHHYYFQALDLMWDHLVNGAPLPPSQVVQTVPRGPERLRSGHPICPRSGRTRPRFIDPLQRGGADDSRVIRIGANLVAFSAFPSYPDLIRVPPFER